MTTDTLESLAIHPGIALYIGDKLRSARLYAGLHQRELAERITIHGSLIALWELDKRPVPHDRIDQLAAALGTTARDLIDGATRRLYAEHKRDIGLKEFVVRAQPEPRRAPTTPAPSDRPSQLWCTSPHAPGGPSRLHSHGYAPSWQACVGRIDLEP